MANDKRTSGYHDIDRPGVACVAFSIFQHKINTIVTHRGVIFYQEWFNEKKYHIIIGL
jgi:hypothetical protein